jgi:hypothetical protein
MRPSVLEVLGQTSDAGTTARTESPFDPTVTVARSKQ